jgi:hypothetical protein
MSQERYIESLSLLSKYADFESFRSMRAKLSWASNSRPDIACAVAFSAQVTPTTYAKESYKLLNKVIKYLKMTKDIQLQYPKLELAPLYLAVYSDASLHNNQDHTSQIGFIILLMDRSARCCVLQFSSHKSRRVTRSSMAAEALAFADAFDHAFILKHDLQRILGREVPLLMLTDSKFLFDVITGNKYTTEKKLMADIASIREAYNDRTISNIALIRREHNAADAMTKIAQNAALQAVLHTHRVSHPLEQNVIDTRLFYDNCTGN